MRKWTRQPPAGTPLDRINPLTHGLVFAANMLGPRIETYPSNKLVEAIGISTLPTTSGTFANLDTNTDYISFANDSIPDFVANGQDFSVLLYCQDGTLVDTNQRLLQRTEDATNVDGFAITANSDTGNLRWTVRKTDVQTQIDSNNALSKTEPTVLIGTAEYISGTSWTCAFWHGPEKSTTSGATAIGVGDNDTFFIGKRRDTSDDPWVGAAGLLVVWDRVLADAEATALIQNPWQIFKRRQFALADVPDDVRFLPVEKPWKKQPPAGTPIDWGNPLTKSMVACFVFNEESGNLRDLVKSRSITQSGTPDRITTPQGLAHAFGGTSDRYVVPNSSELNATGDFTVVVGFTNQEVGQNVEIVEKQLGNPMWQIYNAATGNNLEFYGRDSAGTLITLDSVTTLDVGKYVQAAGVKSVANDRVYLYINGYLEDDVEDTSTGDWSNTADMLIADGSAAGMFNGYIHYLYIFQDAKDAEQIARIHENPWQIFKPQIIHAPADVALPDLATFERDW